MPPVSSSPRPLRSLRRFWRLPSRQADSLASAGTPARARARTAGRTLSLTLVCAALSAAFCAAPAAYAQPTEGRTPTVNVSTVLPPSVMTGLERAHVPLSSMSVVIEKVGDRSPSVAVNAGQPMMPASTMKLVTTWSGLAMLGADYRWKTSAYTDGEVDASGTLHGNLYIKGTGDPKLVPEELIDLVQKIRASGITRIEGALVLDKSEFDPSTRDLPSFDGDDSAPYNVGPDPLMYAFKSVSFTFSPSREGVSIDVVPPVAQWQIDNQIQERPGACRGMLPSPQVTPGANGVVTASFDGNYAMRCGARTLNMAAPVDHSTFFADGFLALWQQAGGSFSGATHEGVVPPRARLVAVHQSPPLGDVVHDINKFSNNVMARNLFLTLGAVEGKPPSTTAKAASAVTNFLHRNGLAMPELVLDNGCGLSREEHISALSLANLLQTANASPVAQVFIDSLPVAGVDGTMRNRLTNAGVGGNAHIKTGTLRDVRAIAGYVAAENGSSWIVVSLINDPRAEGARAAHDALLEWVYKGMPEEHPVYVDPHPRKASKASRAGHGVRVERISESVGRKPAEKAPEKASEKASPKASAKAPAKTSAKASGKATKKHHAAH
ncbi:D-alanyl-D-alanine carboxypeptidase/D-alanyl-D-alanine endopeptidase [Paraburkholderia tropica]|uniref:D-alanyl-D-alanine carboxypeptidase/D-alanyl-D-alanine-endopeptidase (Penicillin-binding protein 4) n=1 Tax=Paraburkholderia tropica TaxID=92647 RepID=A0ABX5MK98_9BURK|nr:D-alanyl-D-alanine carboxypeptidase/D-alanyl-D-alanine-endopeptidase [Paraburkholderia tropica]MDE1143374.1 D-alanyl-D-alanine carboxypeptidase/D-alanyl-D-alanine-endopeptidase [Paraburkholderia tropica]PXX10618.1 D-alanyl-D-alanine carboxypeptidase/D-alanyl-D-alanine-endopeptidase (penicillin-binding protein 4) [Paraburkholderia tropica]PZW75374.1 D-alanyl-D-alanine carboxypeptidase/D-alanyl-D-alanine-endopeptidase (penicillin-binding protein 4) [Paraburkholderia tropica]